ncbi:hypothetical protein DCCM_4375 [Desulfocucumis palustris]|uniref:Uncharacterized protein n=1 Tax=Desulfocucumis palustris TaxID=1898651 RepID=A0A2L2XGI3_9FIRM|nr:hypothetical protein DCCM_4375 [Desulfocucumis palustris]
MALTPGSAVLVILPPSGGTVRKQKFFSRDETLLYFPV